MKISDILSNGHPKLSFEVFPPKNSEAFETVRKAAGEIAMLKPDFMSVTYGAGGGTSQYTVSVACELQKNYSVPTLSHLTCVNSTKEKVHEVLRQLTENGIENIMALRGDLPEDGGGHREYKYASELVKEIKSYGDFCVGGACYPEGHPESDSTESDIEHLKIKVDAGCDFLTTQMFFDNETFYRFADRIRSAGIKVPLVAGIMPVTSAAQIKRIGLLSGGEIPKSFLRIVERFCDDPGAMKQAGIAFTTSQIIELMSNGFNAIHIYSMNKPDVAAKIKSNISDILNLSV